MTNVSLKPWHTMGAAVSAPIIDHVFDVQELEQINWSENPIVLGGGSNILFTKDVARPVIRIATQGIEFIEQDSNYVYLRIAAGENWHGIIEYCLGHNYGGLENLSLIPGTVGAAPIQNIGAYGVELKDSLVSVEYYDKESGEIKELSNEGCFFGYRDSIFKHSLKDKTIITSVVLKLTTKNHKLELGYGAIKDELDMLGIKEPTISDVSKVVVKIRQSKLPDPDEIGNCGSFFKNPVLPEEALQELLAVDPELRYFKLDDGFIKIPAAYLIEKTGLKGYRKGDAGIYKKHALILVNHGTATGSEVWEIANTVMDLVKEKFSIQLVPEVNVL